MLEPGTLISYVRYPYAFDRREDNFFARIIEAHLYLSWVRPTIVEYEVEPLVIMRGRWRRAVIRPWQITGIYDPSTDGG